MMKRFIVRMTLPVLEKARRSSRLIPVKKMVTRDGKVFQTTVWMLPEDVKAGKTAGGQGSLFDFDGNTPTPVMQGDLFDQIPDEPKAKPQDVSGMRVADGDFPKDILRDGEKIGRITEARLNGKVVSYNVRNLAGTLVASGKTPEAALEQFKTGVKKEEPTEPNPPTMKTSEKTSLQDSRKKTAEKLRAVASSLEEKAEAEIGRDRNANTARRARMAGHAVASAQKDAAIARTMKNLADAIEKGEVTKLSGVNSKAAVENLDSILRQAVYYRDRDRFKTYAEQERHQGRKPEIEDIPYAKMQKTSWDNGGADKKKLLDYLALKRGASSLKAKISRSSSPDAEMLSEMKKFLTEKEISYGLGWYNLDALANIGRLNRIGIKTNEDLHAALKEYIDYRDGPKKADPIKEAERALIGQKVGFDFFPTPKSQALRMVELAGIKPGMTVLEPSAGNGNLADAAKEAGASVDVVEVSLQLQNILKLKGHNLVGTDFEEFAPEKKYDAIIMNPPFSNRKDAEHIRLAFDALKPGGKLVAIAGEGVFIGSDKKAVEFRSWLDSMGATIEELPANTFKDKDLLATTGVNARMIEISKPGESGRKEEPLPVGSMKTENGVTYRLNENHRWEKVEEPGTERKLIKKGDGADRNGTVVQDENGKNWLVVSSRSAWITACPIVGGKPQVNADDKKTFHLDEHKIYDTGKVWDYKESRPVDKKESDKPEWAKDPAPSKTIEVESSITDNNVKTTLFKYDEGSLKGKFGIKTTDLDSGKTLPTVFQYSDEEKAREKYRELAGIKNPETAGVFDENRRKLVYANYHDQAEDKIYSAYEKAKEKGRKEDIKAIEDVLSDKKLPLVRNVNDGKTPEGTYKYLMKLRPFGGGAQPEGNIIGFETVDKTKDGGWSVVEYMEPLSKEQLEHFSMEPYKDAGTSTHHVGETKWVNGSQYRLNENHRWEKVDAGETAKEEMAQDSPSEDGKETLASLIERAGGKEKLKTMLLAARKAEREGRGSQIDLSSGKVVNRTTDKVLDGLSNASGLTREEVLAELGIKEGRKPTSKKPKKEKAKTDSGDELDPNSENYKFKDTGYIAGSRKELASERIKDMAEKGQLVRRTDIPWEDLEKNPRQAQTLITKSNLFGSVPWDQLKENGLEPGAGFLIDRIYASVAKEPKDNAASRKDYVYGLESLRDRLEKSKTAGDVLNVLKEIKGEIDGEVYSAREADEYKAAMEELNALAKQERDYKERRDYLAHEANRVGQEISGLKYEKQKRENRGWKVDPEVIKKIAALEKEYEKKLSAHKAFVESHPEMKQETIKHGTWDTGMTYEYRGEFLDKYNAARKKVSDVRKAVVSRNLLENDTTRAWLSLGDRFSAVINYRSFKGSDAFGNHVANARAGNIKDWDWAEKGRITGKKATKESVQFQLKVAEKFERKGGRKISVDSTMALKSMFNLRDVQSGNWVLRDVNSAKFHTENTAMALADMADLLGIPDSQVSLNGRLAMAFGARGSGSAGWSKGAAKAHYEHVQRVINITKNGGGGSLGHEWFHAFDNMLMETMSGEPTGKDIMLTEDPSQVSDPDVRKAFEGIRSAMLDGSVVPPKKITYTMQDYRNAEYGFKRDYGRYGEIKKTGSAQKAVEYLYSLYEKYDVENPSKYDKKALKQRDDWVRTAVAWFDKKEGGGSVTVNIGKPVSSFLMGARDLDEGRSKDYWSSPREMAARAFQSYLEDRLSEKGQKNDYLSVYADNKYHRDPLTGVEFKPYPEGEERKRINEAFDKIFEVVRSKKIIQKAIETENGKARMIKVWRFA